MTPRCAAVLSGSAIRCYSCKDYTASCTKQRDCSYDDACLTLVERGTYRPPVPLDLTGPSGPQVSLWISHLAVCCSAGGMTYRKCLKYTECERSRLAQMFPQVPGPPSRHQPVYPLTSLVLESGPGSGSVPEAFQTKKVLLENQTGTRT